MKYVFDITEEEIRAVLVAMEQDPRYNTLPGYTANVNLWSDNSMPFIEVHLQYLKTHPSLDPEHYLANLKLMTKRRV